MKGGGEGDVFFLESYLIKIENSLPLFVNLANKFYLIFCIIRLPYLLGYFIYLFIYLFLLTQSKLQGH